MRERDTTGQRTEQPTRRRLEEARAKGIVARSADLTAAALTLGGIALLAWVAPTLLAELKQMLAELLASAGAAESDMGKGLWHAVAPVVGTLGLMFVALAAMAVGVNVLQVGIRVTSEPIKPDLGRLCPGRRGAGVLSKRSAMRLLMVLAKVAAVVAVAVLTIRSGMPEIVAAARQSGGCIAAEAGRLVTLLAVRAGLALLALGAVDWLYQRARHRHDLMMTRRELQDELKQTQAPAGGRRRRERLRAATPAGLTERGDGNG